MWLRLCLQFLRTVAACGCVCEPGVGGEGEPDSVAPQSAFPRQNSTLGHQWRQMAIYPDHPASSKPPSPHCQSNPRFSSFSEQEHVPPLGNDHLPSLFPVPVVRLFLSLGDPQRQHPRPQRQQVHWHERLQRGDHVHHRGRRLLPDAGPA